MDLSLGEEVAPLVEVLPERVGRERLEGHDHSVEPEIVARFDKYSVSDQ